MAKRSQPKRKAIKRAPKRKSSRRVKRRAVLASVRRFAWISACVGTLSIVLCVLAYTAYLDHRVRERFEGARWELPARVFARPLELYVSKALSADLLEQELRLLHYEPSQAPNTPGTYWRQGDTMTFHTRGFPFWDVTEPARVARVTFSDDRVAGVFDSGSNTPLNLVRVEPVPIASIYPTHLEDRLVTRLNNVPPLLVKALLAIEDQSFYDHHGLDFGAIARALFANLRAGEVVQGGSTLTQQLVKNLFLSGERSVTRKFNEAIMAVLIEWHYGKDEILETYINEVYLGQDGARAIHGFALGSQFYFKRRLSELQPDEIALLVGIVKGPSYYSPRNSPEQAKARRDLVLSELDEQDILTASTAGEAQRQPLGVSASTPSGITPFPAFVELMRRQLRDHYPEQALRSEGLVIFTTLDPLVQIEAERAVALRLKELETVRGLPADSLQAAVVVTAADSGEVLALVGGRDPRLAGYNRALDARRPVGSLIKPAVYLTALSRPGDYSLATLLEDKPLSIRTADHKTWSPQNYDQTYHGPITLRDALIGSYNVPTARLGLAVGVDSVIGTLHALGMTRDLREYPSLLLGATEMTLLEVNQMYQTLAAGGYRTPLSAIREVMGAYGEPRERYPLKVVQAADPRAVYLLNATLYEVTRQGTARALQSVLPASLKVAGKTGTTDGLRDSWFAGFSGEHVVVAWVGRDDNQSTGLTGASGALTIWGDIMSSVPTRPINFTTPSTLEWLLIDTQNGLLAADYCEHAQWMPFIEGTAPSVDAPCVRTSAEGMADWIKGLFD